MNLEGLWWQLQQQDPAATALEVAPIYSGSGAVHAVHAGQGR